MGTLGFLTTAFSLEISSRRKIKDSIKINKIYV
jgi:hypothetical protein